VKLWLVFASVIFASGSLLALPASPDTTMQAWSSGPGWWDFVKVIMILVMIIGLIWVSLAGLKKLSAQRGGGIAGAEVIGALALGPKRSLIFVRIAGTVHIIGATDQNLNSIGTIDDPGVIDALSNRGVGQQPNFGDLLKRVTGRTKPGGGAEG
jgi:flagellar biogenesis protein FliO